ncbi:MAG: hypothetical protein MZW92_33745 [Comamonadaceae bacterium]|nr:hypothetical protein [Comamonadaceae bacterium]
MPQMPGGLDIEQFEKRRASAKTANGRGSSPDGCDFKIAAAFMIAPIFAARSMNAAPSAKMKSGLFSPRTPCQADYQFDSDRP